MPSELTGTFLGNATRPDRLSSLIPAPGRVVETKYRVQALDFLLLTRTAAGQFRFNEPTGGRVIETGYVIRLPGIQDTSGDGPFFFSGEHILTFGGSTLTLFGFVPGTTPGSGPPPPPSPPDSGNGLVLFSGSALLTFDGSIIAVF